MNEHVWINPDRISVEPRFKLDKYNFIYVKAAQNRLMRFLPYLELAFSDTAPRKGIIESQLYGSHPLEEALKEKGMGECRKVCFKDDAHLPITGSVKGRGAVHGVLRIAEGLAFKEEKLKPLGDYKTLLNDDVKEFFGTYTILTTAKGNFAKAVEKTARTIGFQVITGASEEEKNNADDHTFVLEEYDSEDVFFGYATAAMRLKVQLTKAKIEVTRSHPLTVFLPCVGGCAAGGLAFGLKQMFGDAVHCIFVGSEMTPWFEQAMKTGKADGPVCNLSVMLMKSLLDGIVTVPEEELIFWQNKAEKTEEWTLSKIACAGFSGARMIGEIESCRVNPENTTVIIWMTGQE